MCSASNFSSIKPTGVQFDAGNIIIGLHPEGEEVKVSPTTGMSIGIYVDDMDKAVAEIRRRFGKIAVGPRAEPFGRWALVFDPDGYSIQIIEMARSLRAQHKLAPEPPKSPELGQAKEIPPPWRRDLQSSNLYLCGLHGVIVVMMVMLVVLSGKRRHGCAQQQNTGQYGNHRFLQRISSPRTPLGAPTLFLALCLAFFPRPKVYLNSGFPMQALFARSFPSTISIETIYTSFHLNRLDETLCLKP